MLYIVLTIGFLALTIIFLLAGGFYDFHFFILLFFGLTVFFGYKSYQVIFNPIYIEKEIENSNIPSIDTKKNNSGKYDKVYIDEEKQILYIDKKIYDKGEVTIVEDNVESKIVVKKYVPKFTYNSVNLYFNQKIEYIIYIPSEYEINSLLNF